MSRKARWISDRQHRTLIPQVLNAHYLYPIVRVLVIDPLPLYGQQGTPAVIFVHANSCMTKREPCTGDQGK